MYLLVAFNVLLDLWMSCTSGGARVSDSAGLETMLHFRTLDWSMDPLRKVVVHLDFVENPGGTVLASICRICWCFDWSQKRPKHVSQLTIGQPAFQPFNFTSIIYRCYSVFGQVYPPYFGRYSCLPCILRPLLAFCSPRLHRTKLTQDEIHSSLSYI